MRAFPDKILEYETVLVAKPKKNTPNRHHLKLYYKKTEIAFLSFDFDDELVWAYEINIVPKFRRIGIGTELYNAIQSWTDKPIQFQRTAISSDAMRCLLDKLIKIRKVISDDGTFVVLAKLD